jgi:Fe-S-cluster formation regulator IscX/YfhJ
MIEVISRIRSCAALSMGLEPRPREGGQEMAETLKPSELEELGEALFDAYPDANPLDVDVDELREFTRALQRLDSARLDALDAEALESVRMEWCSIYSAHSC